MMAGLKKMRTMRDPGMSKVTEDDGI
jgi:hypothetical protein